MGWWFLRLAKAGYGDPLEDLVFLAISGEGNLVTALIFLVKAVWCLHGNRIVASYHLLYLTKGVCMFVSIFGVKTKSLSLSRAPLPFRQI